jgi:2-oxoglutarate dehydrogenase E2 component (dihydrolipoamide succinyltransferase)
MLGRGGSSGIAGRVEAGPPDGWTIGRAPNHGDVSMAIAVELPALGESVVEGTVSRWLVQEGDYVELDQPIVEVTTDKVDAEIPAPSAGVVQKILVAEGDVVEVGAKLAEIDPDAVAGEGAEDAGSAPSAKETRSDEPAERPASPRAEAREPERPAAEEEEEEPAEDAGDQPRATPVARRLAEEANVALSGIEGSGSAGRITKDDVLRHTRRDEADEADSAGARARAPEQAPASRADGGQAAEADTRQATRAEQPPAERAPARRPAQRPAYASYALQEGDRVVPMSPMRRIIAEHMVYSKRTSPHVGTVAEVDMGAVAALRASKKAAFESSQGIKLTFLPFIVHAVARALREHPALNASVVEDSIVEKRDIHIGLAVETEKGLVVPVVRHADRLSLSGLAASIDDLASRARNKRLSADDLQGGTFTVSNPGRQGNLYGFAIINQPQVGILRMGEMVKRPVVRSVEGEDAIVIRPMMHLALSYDHRAVDGAPANGFLYRIRELLEAADFDL